MPASLARCIIQRRRAPARPLPTTCVTGKNMQPQLAAILKVTNSVVVAVTFLEMLILLFVAKRNYDWRSALASIGVVIGRTVFEILVPITLAMPGAYWLYQHRLME